MIITKNGKLGKSLRIFIAITGILAGHSALMANEDIVWVRQIGTPEPDKWAEVETDSERRIIVGGYTGGSVEIENLGGLDFLLAKYNPDGALRWIRQFGTEGEEKINALTVDNANRIIVVGYTTGSLAADHKGSIDGVVAKFNAGGKLLWMKQYALSTPEWDYPAGVAVDDADNIYVAGYTEGSLARPNAGFRDYFLAKFSPTGKLLWRRQHGGEDLDAAYSIAVDVSGNVLIGGFTRNSLDGVNQGAADVFIAKYNGDGDRLWLRQYGTEKTEGVSGLATDSLGNVVIGGRTSGEYGGPYLGTVDTFVAKYSADGDLQWARQLASRKFERLYDVAIDANDDILVVGHTDGELGSSEGGPDPFPEVPYKAKQAFTAKYTPAGELLWIRQYGSQGLEGGYGVTADTDHYVLAVGVTTGWFGAWHQGNLDAFLVKLAP